MSAPKRRTPEELRQAKAAFLEALEREPAEREGWVAGRSDLPDAVRELVLAQLRRYSSEPDLAPAVAASDHEQSLADPESIGPYRVLRRLGEGGMGVVYECQQSAPVQRIVAVKRLKSGMDSAAIVRRFEAERQVLARMSHPAIAQIYDGGIDAGGRPFFAMEWIDGAPVTAYADARRLSLEARLRLFVKLCRGVEHAHQRGVLHRDLKPANVLVTEVDGEAQPKVIDFGIAKAVGEDFGAETMHTLHGAVLGTPRYMSPEAASGEGDVDTRSDVYSLGVLLHELVTGVLPEPAQRAASSAGGQTPSTRSGAAAPVRAEPSRPSTHFRVGREGLIERSAVRAASAASLGRALRSDLDWILLRALRVARQERYESVSALARDVERHLGHQAVEAGPPSLGYRLRRGLRRHRRVVLVGGFVALCLFGGAAASLHFGLESARQERLTWRNLLEAYEVLSRTQTSAWFQDITLAGSGRLEAIQNRILSEYVPDFEQQRARVEDSVGTNRGLVDASDEWIQFLGGVAAAAPDEVRPVIRDILTERARNLLYWSQAEAAVRAAEAARALCEDRLELSDPRPYYVQLLSLDALLAAGQHAKVLERLAEHRAAAPEFGDGLTVLRYRARLGNALVQAGRAASPGPEREALLDEAEQQLAVVQERLIPREPDWYGSLAADAAWVELQALLGTPARAESSRTRLRHAKSPFAVMLFPRQALGYGTAEDALWDATNRLLGSESEGPGQRLEAVRDLQGVARDHGIEMRDPRWRALLLRLSQYTTGYWNVSEDEACHELCAFAGEVARAHRGAPGFTVACVFHALSLLSQGEVAQAAERARDGFLFGRQALPVSLHLWGWCLVRLGHFDAGLERIARGWVGCISGAGVNGWETNNSAQEFAVGSAVWRWGDPETAGPRVAALEAELVRDNPLTQRPTLEAAMAWAEALYFNRAAVQARAERLMEGKVLRRRAGYWLARALSRVGEAERARACLESLRPGAAADGPARVAEIDGQLGALWLRHGRFEKARTAYLRAQELDPDDPWAAAGLAHIAGTAPEERVVDGVSVSAQSARKLFRDDGELRLGEWTRYSVGDYVTVPLGGSWVEYLQALASAGRVEDARARCEAVLSDPYGGIDAREGVARFLAITPGLGEADRSRALEVARMLAERTGGRSMRIEATLAEAELATGALDAGRARLLGISAKLAGRSAEWITLAEVQVRLDELDF